MMNPGSPKPLAALLIAALAASVFHAAPQAGNSRRPPIPRITRPLLYDTPQADRILEALQVFPADNPWNTDISKWPLHPKSQKIVASIGTAKPFRCNPDMGFILIPPDQKKIAVKLVSYPDESDKGPFPVPNALPIEG